MADEMTKGIPDPDNPENFLVPPWPADTKFCGVVRHFLRYHVWGSENTAHLLAYYKGYQSALNAAPRERPHPVQQGWYEAMLECIDACVKLYSEKYADESANNNHVVGAGN